MKSEFKLPNLNKSAKVLLMLSGGKDSVACMYILKTSGLETVAIHFTHDWSYALSTNEAARLCNDMGVPLIRVDFTSQFFSAVEGFRGGRPCLLCKREMYQIVIKHALENNFNYICIGDNANDTTTIQRLITHAKTAVAEELVVSDYLGRELGLQLSHGIKIIRPLLGIYSGEVETYLARHGIEIERNHCTGDRYFSYWREGCSAQFHDPGCPITKSSLDELHKYSTLITEYARKKNIRASIHWPSRFVVTVPEGYEDEALEYLKEKGLSINQKDNGENLQTFRYPLTIWNINRSIVEQVDVLEALLVRFLERLGITSQGIHKSKFHEQNFWIYQFISGSLIVFVNKATRSLYIDLILSHSISEALLANLSIEVFRSRDYIFYK